MIIRQHYRRYHVNPIGFQGRSALKGTLLPSIFEMLLLRCVYVCMHACLKGKTTPPPDTFPTHFLLAGWVRLIRAGLNRIAVSAAGSRLGLLRPEVHVAFSWVRCHAWNF